MKALIKLLTSMLMFSVIVTAQVQAKPNTNEEFPVRKLYPAVPVVELKDLKARQDQVIIVDVRSAYEYQTLRMVGALNIPLSSPNFLKEMEQLRKSNPNKEIVVYCNGKTCKKSYKATQKCRDHSIPNVTAYDAGIFDWARAYPQEAILLGETPVDPGKLIAKSDFKKKLMDPAKFEALMARNDIIVLDIRDRFQREALSLFPGIEKRVYLDDNAKLDKYLEQAARENKTLLVYDAAGKQVRWLMYRIEKKGVKSYAFMKGGAHAYFASLRNQFNN